MEKSLAYIYTQCILILRRDNKLLIKIMKIDPEELFTVERENKLHYAIITLIILVLPFILFQDYFINLFTK